MRSSGDTIRSNIAVIRQCKSVAAAQHSTVRALEGQVRRDADSARGQQQSTGAVIEIEKDRIVSMLRENASALGGVPAASSQPPMGVPVAVATAALDDVLPLSLIHI